MQTPDDAFNAEDPYQHWEHTYQSLGFDLKGGEELHRLVLLFAYHNKLTLHRLDSRWPKLSWIAVSRSTQTGLILTACYILALTLYLAKQHDHRPDFLFGLLPLWILCVTFSVYWFSDRREWLSGYRYFRRATALRDYTDVNVPQLLTELTKHIHYLLTLRGEAGCQAIAYLLCNLQQQWIDEPSVLLNPSAPLDTSETAITTWSAVPRANTVNFLLFIVLKKMAYPLIDTSPAQRYLFLATLVDDAYYRHHPDKLGQLLTHFFAPPRAADPYSARGYEQNLKAYCQLDYEQKKRILTALLNQTLAGESITKRLLDLPEKKRFRDQLLTHFVTLKKPNAVRIQLQSQHYRTLPEQDSDVISTLLSP